MSQDAKVNLTGIESGAQLGDMANKPAALSHEATEVVKLLEQVLAQAKAGRWDGLALISSKQGQVQVLTTGAGEKGMLHMAACQLADQLRESVFRPIEPALVKPDRPRLVT